MITEIKQQFLNEIKQRQISRDLLYSCKKKNTQQIERNAYCQEKYKNTKDHGAKYTYLLDVNLHRRRILDNALSDCFILFGEYNPSQPVRSATIKILDKVTTILESGKFTFIE